MKMRRYGIVTLFSAVAIAAIVAACRGTVADEDVFYELSIGPETLVVEQGGSAEATVELVSHSLPGRIGQSVDGSVRHHALGRAAQVDLVVGDAPAGITIEVHAPSVSAQQRVLTVRAGIDAALGEHEIRVEGRPEHKAGSATLSVQVIEPQPLQVELTAPEPDILATGEVQLSAAVSGQAGAKAVQFQADGSPVGRLLMSAPYTTMFDSSAVDDGYVELAAIAWNKAGEPAASNARQVVVANETGVVSGRLTGEVEVSMQVFLFDIDSGETLHELPARAESGFAFRFVGVAPGVYGLDAGDCDPSACTPTWYGYADDDLAVATSQEFGGHELEIFNMDDVIDDILVMERGRSR